MSRIFVYNPTCEIALGNGTGTYQPTRQLAEFERDLAGLMLFACSEGDFVVAESPDTLLLQTLRRAGIGIPQFITQAEARKLIAGGHQLVPWGKSIEVFKRFGMNDEAAAFDGEKRLLHSRLTSVDLEERIARLPLPEFLQTNFLPRIISTESEALSILSSPPYVLKSQWSSSGRGVQIVQDQSTTKAAMDFALSRIRRGEKVIVEPLLSRISELSFLFCINECGSVDYLGKNVFQADEKGNFGKEIIGKAVGENLPTDWEQASVEILKNVLVEWSSETDYKGFIGFDSMIYSDGESVRLRLCTEANLRMCMGNVNLGVAKMIASGSSFEWSIHHFPADGAWNSYCSEMERLHPLSIDGNGKIIRGFLRLTGLGNQKHWGAAGLVTARDLTTYRRDFTA